MTKDKLSNLNWGNIAISAALLSAIATCIIAICNWNQLRIMKNTQNVMQESFKAAQKPHLMLNLRSDPNMGSTASYLPTDEEGGERWEMPYFVINNGSNVAYKLRYYHIMTTDSIIKYPTAKELSSIHQNNMIEPNDIFQCGIDNYLRQSALDIFKRNGKLFRHFYVIFEDEAGNSYKYRAIWEISYYEKGKPLDFKLDERNKLTDWNP